MPDRLPGDDANSAGLCLGIEGGGTRTTVLLAAADDSEVAAFDAGPANLRLMHPGDLAGHLREIRGRLPRELGSADRIGIGLAGVRLEADHDRLRTAVAKVWPGVPCATSDDLVTALEAGEWRDDCAAQVLVLSGTGSCVSGRNRSGEKAKLGGRGHVLGDRASACDMAQHALRALMTISDLEERWPTLGADFLAHLQMNEPEDLIDWSMVATKTELASLAVPIFRAAEVRADTIARAVLEKAAARLTTDAAACAGRLASGEEPVQFVFNGAVLLKNPSFASMVGDSILAEWPGSVVTPLERPSVWGAIALARRCASAGSDVGGAGDSESEVGVGEESDAVAVRHPVAKSATEARNPDTTEFASLPVAEGLAMMLAEESKVAPAVAAESAAIEWTVGEVVRAFAEGGRLFYTGAGTSGRLGVLDASECPPTFRAGREQVQGIIAGGREALWRAVEGAEDDPVAGARAIAGRGVGASDVVVGISASGHAPFVWGSLEEANRRGARTVLLCCNPAYRDHGLPDCVIVPDTGAEALTGSTRLKAGSATKVVLNLITTLAMAHSGKVLGNLMVDLNPSNVKLRDRALRIVRELTGAGEEEARAALESSRWVVRAACESLSG